LVEFNAKHKAVLDELLLELPHVRPGKMFGYPAYYAGKKLSICIVGEGVGLKLPESTANQLLEEDPNITHFQPLGRRKMREWVQINLEDSSEFKRYLDIFTESIAYVLMIQ
jgi:hypothetical protein